MLSQTVIIPLSQLPFSLLGQNKPLPAAHQHITAHLHTPPSIHLPDYSKARPLILLLVLLFLCVNTDFYSRYVLSWGKTTHMEGPPLSHWIYPNGIYLNGGHPFSGQWLGKLPLRG